MNVGKSDWCKLKNKLWRFGALKKISDQTIIQEDILNTLKCSRKTLEKVWGSLTPAQKEELNKILHKEEKTSSSEAA